MVDLYRNFCGRMFRCRHGFSGTFSCTVITAERNEIIPGTTGCVANRLGGERDAIGSRTLNIEINFTSSASSNSIK